MRRRRATARFYIIILILLLLIVFFILRPRLNIGIKTDEDVVFASNSSYAERADCIIIRDESLVASPSIVRVEYIATENSLVAKGDTVANLYTAGYSENLLARLETTRQNIQAYHKNLIGTIVDSNLDRLEAAIDISAADFKNLVTHQTTGNLQTVTAQLTTAMVNRQDYLRQNKRDDTRLTALYEEENTQLTSIQSWRKVSTAEHDGVVSFYLDGYENDLTADRLESFTLAEIQTVLNGGVLSNTADTKANGIYRIVNQEKWYVIVVSDNNSGWNPIVGQDDFYLQLEGFDDLVYNATVTSVQKTNTAMIVTFEINQPIGPLIYQRTGKATISITLSGLAVHSRALDRQGDQTGVWVYDTPSGTFVPVIVLSDNGDEALIQPVTDGALQVGNRLLIK